MKKQNVKIAGILAAAAVLLSSISYFAGRAAVPVSAVPGGEIECYFPRAGQSAENQLISVINHSEKTLDVAIYSFTLSDVGDAILKAKQRGVAVRIMTDQENCTYKYEEPILQELKKAKIPIKKNTHDGLMHLKVAIADQKAVTTGSFNYTWSAQNKNDEVFVVIHNASTVAEFEKDFNAMWNDKQNYASF